MEKMYFLTAMFQNKFGKAMKYYDDKGWHWMLASDKPILFSDFQSAKSEANELSKDILSEIVIKEIAVHSGLYEHKMNADDTTFFQNIFNERLEGKYRYVLSKEKQLEEAKEITGLYRINKEQDTWIYGSVSSLDSPEEDFPFTSDELIFLSLQKLQEAKALMQIFDYEKSEISKLDGVMLFVARLVKDKESSVDGSDEILDSPEKCIKSALLKLQEAKKVMQKKNADKTEITKLEGVLVFVMKLDK